MRSGVAILTVAAFASVPLWLRDPYLLNALITTGIFIIAAMSLNLLLGFTGQLSLGHVAFFGIGAYTSALTSLGFDVPLPGGLHVVHDPWPPIAGFALAVVIAGLCGYFVGRLSFRVRGAYFVIVTISFAEVVRLVAEGQSSREIAEQLHISVKTAEFHRGRIMQKLQIHSTAGLVRYAIREGLIIA